MRKVLLEEECLPPSVPPWRVRHAGKSRSAVYFHPLGVVPFTYAI